MSCKRLCLVAAVALAPCAHAADSSSAPGPSAAGRWQIHSVVNGMSLKDGKPDSRADNTILLDTETGKTWILWPTKDAPPAGWRWLELERKNEPAKPPAARP